MREKRKIRDKIKRKGSGLGREQRQKEEFYLHLEVQSNDETIEERKVNFYVKSIILELKSKSGNYLKSRE